MTARKPDTATRIAIAEDMTIYNAAAHKQVLIEALNAGPELEIDLSGVGEIDTSGFQLLVLLKREAHRLNIQARIVAHSEAVRELLDFYNMAAEFGDPLLMPAKEA